ncbi:hypothetical protein LINPERPRIM_LOCUS15262 [Linum perenne]
MIEGSSFSLLALTSATDQSQEPN